MKKVNRHLLILAGILCFSLFFLFSACSNGTKGLEYHKQDGFAIVVGYSGSSQKVTIPKKVDGCTVVAIANDAFCNSNIKEIKIPSNIKNIGENAFKGSSQLEKVDIADGVLTIGAGTFKNCKNLKEIEIPDTLTTIESELFYGCAITKVDIHENIESIGEGAFRGCKYLSDINIDAKLTELHNNVFFGCTSLEKIVLPLELKMIHSGVFSGCSSLKDINIADLTKLWTIGNEAFKGCVKIEEVTIPMMGPSLGARCFQGCTGLKEVNFKYDEFTGGGFEDEAFDGCTGLTTVVLPKGFLHMDHNVFNNCGDLTIYSLKTQRPARWWTGWEGSSYVSWYSETPKPTRKWWHYVNGVITEWPN